MVKIINFKEEEKTLELIKLSSWEKYRIVTDQNNIERIVNLAKEMGLEIPQPITRKQLNLCQYSKEKTPILIDELDWFIKDVLNRDVYAITIDAQGITNGSSLFKNFNDELQSVLLCLVEKYKTLMGKNDFNLSYQVLKNIEKIKEITQEKQ